MRNDEILFYGNILIYLSLASVFIVFIFSLFGKNNVENEDID